MKSDQKVGKCQILSTTLEMDLIPVMNRTHQLELALEI